MRIINKILIIFVMGLVGSNYPMKTASLEPLPFTFSKHHIILSKMNNQTEIWKNVKGYEGLYKVSNLGNVKSLNRLSLINRLIKERILRPSTNRSGYLQVVLFKNKIRLTRSVHQLVAESFYNHIPCGFELVVNHKDFNKLNNHKDNIGIVTQRVNSNKKHIKHSSKYTGVYWSNKSNKWGSVILFNGKNIYLGYFEDENEASLYYNNALMSIKNNTKINIKKPNFTSEFVGVSWDKISRKWTSQIEINGKGIRLGSFDSENEASAYYQNALVAKKNNKEIKIKKAIFSSKYTGVYMHKRDKKWAASIKINGKNMHLGYFVNEIDASNAYQNELKTIKTCV